MAEDTRVVLDAAGVERAHVVGVSMGGMIAQVFAATQPQRVRTLTSIMSTTGNPRPSVALGKSRALRALLKRPPGNPTIDQVVDHLEFVFGIIGSPGFRQHAAQLRPHFERVARRGLYPAGTSRQLAAILASGDRREMLHRDHGTHAGHPRCGRSAGAHRRRTRHGREHPWRPAQDHSRDGS